MLQKKKKKNIISGFTLRVYSAGVAQPTVYPNSLKEQLTCELPFGSCVTECVDMNKHTLLSESDKRTSGWFA